jgi:hypothetical protein
MAMTNALARIDDDGVPDSLGPAMAALANDRHRAFVMHYVVVGVAAEAARRAGFGNEKTIDKDYARIGYRLLRNDAIRAAVMEETRAHYHVAAAAAVREVRRILDSPTAKDADKLRAADSILARFDPVTTNQVMRIEHEHRHRHSLSADEITRRIAELAAKVGVALPAPVIDATAEEVPACPT